jgi:hypothetical protein
LIQKMSEQTYQEVVSADIRDCVEEMRCRPILFVGAGLSRRYMQMPDWKALLDLARAKCPLLEKELTYYVQRSSGELPQVATIFSEAFHEYAWGTEGRDVYPPELFTENVTRDIYLKYSVKKIIEKIQGSPTTAAILDSYSTELEALKRIRPFAIVTTNYDQLLEWLFPQYHVTVGEQILRADLAKIGDLLKIHGSISRPESLVLTSEDYKDYSVRQRYLSAKLLTYFLEHPIVFLGYSVTDPNIRELLLHIDLILAARGQCIGNIYLVEYSSQPEDNPPREAIIPTGNDRHVRVKQITTNQLDWVYEAFGHQSPVEIDIKVLRSMESMIQRLVRTDIPTGNIEVDYKSIASLGTGQAGKLTIVGLAPLNDLSQAKAHYRHTITAVAHLLGFEGWYKVNELIKKIALEKGIDIKSFDNRYHQATNYGKSVIHEYSDELVAVLKLVRDSQAYELVV